MDAEAIRDLLKHVREGRLSVAQAERKLRASPAFVDLGFATVDHHRELRQGHAEVIYAAGKTPRQVVAIARQIVKRTGSVLVTRADPVHVRALRRAYARAVHHKDARAVTVQPARKKRSLRPGIALVAAGTADLPVAEEARVTCRFLGHEPEAVYDVGVAGLHRLLARTDALQRARVVIAVAGMEGALASVVGGLVGAPVVGLPTSVGYGTGSGGLAALLSMLNSCAANVCCVNIDDGFGAAVVACLINRASD
ncbi:MAG: nickel pincer cofactor biosynthesis protein LarB [Planctomycetota bacterium]|nr:nickel pincer cofactor biosynthesis protein LarB [Planctomycetota bacterium]